MSYRTYINDHEWLGNNEMYNEIYQELVRQGCPFDEVYWDSTGSVMYKLTDKGKCIFAAY